MVAKWGEAANAGFQIIPDVLVKNQKRLGLSPTELVVLINLTMHWWYPERKPFPRSRTIAARMGVEVRTVQRALAQLRDLGLIRREKIETPDGSSTVIELNGLVDALSALALEDVAYRSMLSRSAGPQTDSAPLSPF